MWPDSYKQSLLNCALTVNWPSIQKHLVLSLNCSCFKNTIFYSMQPWLWFTWVRSYPNCRNTCICFVIWRLCFSTLLKFYHKGQLRAQRSIEEKSKIVTKPSCQKQQYFLFCLPYKITFSPTVMFMLQLALGLRGSYKAKIAVLSISVKY